MVRSSLLEIHMRFRCLPWLNCSTVSETGNLVKARAAPATVKEFICIIYHCAHKAWEGYVDV